MSTGYIKEYRHLKSSEPYDEERYFLSVFFVSIIFFETKKFLDFRSLFFTMRGLDFCTIAQEVKNR